MLLLEELGVMLEVKCWAWPGIFCVAINYRTHQVNQGKRSLCSFDT